VVGLDLTEGLDEHPLRLFHRTYPILLVGNCLFDLMVTSSAAEFSGAELAQHVEESIHRMTECRQSQINVNEEDGSVHVNNYSPRWADEQIPEFQRWPMQNILEVIYDQFCGTIWPLIKDDHHLRMTTSLVNIHCDRAEFNLYRLS